MNPNLEELIDLRPRHVYCGMTMLPVAFEGEWMKYNEVLGCAVVKVLQLSMESQHQLSTAGSSVLRIYKQVLLSRKSSRGHRKWRKYERQDQGFEC